jgi:PAS domain S-box-containing protein
MRIDIPPEALQERNVPGTSRPATRLVTKRAKPVAAPPQEVSGPLTSSDSDFQQLFQSVYDAAVVTDMAGKIVSVNSRAAKFFRYSREELSSLSILDLISGSNENLITTIKQNLEERFVLIELCYCTRKDGTFVPAEVAVNLMNLSNREYLCFFLRDISLRKEAEEKLIVVKNAIQNSGSGIAITDLDAKIQYVNPAVCLMWGYADASQLEGKDVRNLLDPEAVEVDFISSITSGNEARVREATAVKSDGNRFNAQIMAAANRNSDGELVGMVFSFVDISDRKRAEEAEREAERQRVMLESLGAACHHLGQPATVLLANLGIMRHRSDGGNEDMKELVDACLTAAEALSETLHKLNAINEYRTTPYLEDTDGTGETRILQI